MTLFVDWVPLPDGRWIAKCDTFPAWSFQSEHPEVFPPKDAADKSLRTHVRKHVQIQHMASFNPAEDAA